MKNFLTILTLSIILISRLNAQTPSGDDDLDW